MGSTNEQRGFVMSDDNDRITNKDVLNTLNQMKDNHLNHIERNTEDTNKKLDKIMDNASKAFWVIVGFYILFFLEDILIKLVGG